jgi:lipocalin-like protein
MDRRNLLTISAISVLATSLMIGSTVAQQKSLKDQLIGTWILVEAVDVQPDGSKVNPWGSSPLGTYMFDGSGRFAQMLIRSDLPKIANRAQGTADQNKAVVTGSVAMYGTYSVNEAEKLITLHFEGSTFASFNGTDGKRSIVSLTPDELRVTNPNTSTGTRADSVWRRAK